MSFLEEIKAFKNEANLETKIFKEKIKEVVKYELKKDYNKESGIAIYYMIEIYETNEWKNRNSFVQDEGLSRIILKELYDELKNEIYVRVGYDNPTLKSIKVREQYSLPFSPSIDENVFYHASGNYIKIDTNKSKNESDFTIDEDEKESSLKFQAMQSEYIAKVRLEDEAKKLQREKEEKERQDAKDKKLLGKIKKMLKF